MQTNQFSRHAHARLLVCAKRLLHDGEPVDAKWIAATFKVGIAAARRDVRWLRMYLPLRIIDGRRGRPSKGGGGTVRLLPLGLYPHQEIHEEP